MRRFTFTDLNRQSGEVLEAAMDQPVVLTRRGKEKLVILRAELYRSLTEREPAGESPGSSMSISDPVGQEMLRILGRGSELKG